MSKKIKGIVIIVVVLVLLVFLNIYQDEKVQRERYDAPLIERVAIATMTAATQQAQEALPEGFATLEPVAAERVESDPTDAWFHAWGPVLAFGLVILMLFGSNISLLRVRGVK